MFRKIVLILGFAASVIPLAGQQKTKIDVKSSKYFIVDNPNSRTKFIEDVYMVHENLRMWCDSLYKYDLPDSSYIEAFGHIRAIQNDTIHLSGEYMHYDEHSKIAKLRRNVELRDPSMTLTTNHLDYNSIFEYGQYYSGGRLKDNINTLDSKQGTYFTQTKTAVFRDSVVVDAPDYWMYSDTMRYNTVSKIVYIIGPTNIYGKGEDNNTLYSEDGWYDTNINRAELYKNNRVTHLSYTAYADTMLIDSVSQKAFLLQHVTIIDTANQVIIKGNYAEADNNTNNSFVTDKALLILPGKQDSLFLHSETLYFSKDTIGNNLIKAYHKTRFFSMDLQGVCDSMVYHTADSLINLYKDPVVWASGNQLTGDVISLLTGNGVAKEFYLKNNALMISRREGTDMYDQIKGRDITGYFRDNELYMVYVDGNGETIYYPDDNGTVVGINFATSPNIRIRINQRRISSITFLKNTEGQMKPPIKESPEDARLKEFKWLIHLRPVDKDDIFNVPPPLTGTEGNEENEGSEVEKEESVESTTD